MIVSILYFIVAILFAAMMHVVVSSNYYLLIVWLILGLLASFVLLLLIVIIQLPLLNKLSLTNKYKHKFYQNLAYFLDHVIFRLKITVTGLEHVPKDGLLTIYANHKSYVDPILLMELIDRPTSFTPKMGVYKIPFVKGILKSVGSFPIDRSSDRNTARAMVDAIKVVKAGVAMVIFPEGGIKDRDDIKMVSMRAGAYRLGMKAGANLLPVSIHGSTDIKHRFPWRSTPIKVIIHEPIMYADVKDLKTSEIADQMFKLINNDFEKNDSN